MPDTTTAETTPTNGTAKKRVRKPASQTPAVPQDTPLSALFRVKSAIIGEGLRVAIAAEADAIYRAKYASFGLRGANLERVRSLCLGEAERAYARDISVQLNLDGGPDLAPLSVFSRRRAAVAWAAARWTLDSKLVEPVEALLHERLAAEDAG